MVNLVVARRIPAPVPAEGAAPLGRVGPPGYSRAMEPLVPGAFALRLVVGPEDIDAQGHVSNVRVVDWLNRAAIAHSEAVGLDLARYRALGGTFVVRRHEIDYLAPAFEGDEVVVHTWVVSCRRARAERRHEMRRASDGRALARGFNVWAWVDLEGRPARMPAEVEAAFAPPPA